MKRPHFHCTETTAFNTHVVSGSPLQNQVHFNLWVDFVELDPSFGWQPQRNHGVLVLHKEYILERDNAILGI